VNESVTGVRFATKWKNPHKVREIIEYDKVVFKTRNYSQQERSINHNELIGMEQHK
jgi:hypothetical protein